MLSTAIAARTSTMVVEDLILSRVRRCQTSLQQQLGFEWPGLDFLLLVWAGSFCAGPGLVLECGLATGESRE